MIEHPWNSVGIDPNYENGAGSGWPSGSATAVPDYAWGVIGGAIKTCYEQFGFTIPTDSFAYNTTFSAQNDGLSPTNIENYFELLTMPEPGVTGSVRFWHYDSDGSGPYYKTISIPWTVVPNYYVEPDSITPFSGTQTSPTATVNGQTAAVYNTNGAQNTYTGTVTFGAEPDPISSSNAGSITYRLWQLMNLPDDSIVRGRLFRTRRRMRQQPGQLCHYKTRRLHSCRILLPKMPAGQTRAYLLAT